METIVIKPSDLVVRPNAVQALIAKKVVNYRTVVIGKGSDEVEIKVPYTSIKGAQSESDREVIECASLLCDEGLGYFYQGKRISISLLN